MLLYVQSFHRPRCQGSVVYEPLEKSEYVVRERKEARRYSLYLLY
jgi:hypothetical protein